MSGRIWQILRRTHNTLSVQRNRENHIDAFADWARLLHYSRARYFWYLTIRFVHTEYAIFSSKIFNALRLHMENVWKFSIFQFFWNDFWISFLSKNILVLAWKAYGKEGGRCFSNRKSIEITIEIELIEWMRAHLLRTTRIILPLVAKSPLKASRWFSTWSAVGTHSNREARKSNQ